MEAKDLKEKLKTAQSVSSKAEKPDGYVYGYLKGKKEFFPLDKIVLPSCGNITVSDLVDKVERLENYIQKLEVALNKRIDEICQFKIID